MSFGVHLTIDGYGASPAKLADRAFLQAWLEGLPGQIGMRKIAPAVIVEVGPQNAKDPGGLSGFVLICESHISLHTFPRRQFLSADIYTCQDGLKIDPILARFRSVFGLSDVETNLIRRGQWYPEANIDVLAAT